jgi:NAD(P)-dependent dehydrogenase (short-subunit alcohol dehydrogenase family)
VKLPAASVAKVRGRRRAPSHLLTGWPEATAYAAANSGLISMVRTLGRELAPEQIIVNAVAPGFTDTPQLQVDVDQ